MDENMQPWRLGRIQRRARSVIEMPANVIAATGKQAGEILTLKAFEP